MPNEEQPLSLQRGSHRGMLPHTAPSRSNCTAFSYAARGAIERLPDHDPRQQRGEGHSRSYSKTSIAASLANRMPLHILLGATGFPASQSSHKPPQETHPGLSAPKRKARSQSACVLASCGSAAFTARLLCSGCINRSRPANLSPNHPAAFCGRVPRLRRDPRPQKRRARIFNQSDIPINQDPPYPQTA